MKSKLLTPLYLLVISTWLLYTPFFINRKWLHFNMAEVLNNYVTDLLCIPLVLSSTLVLMQKLKRNNEIKLSALQITIAVIYFAVVFEWLLPENNMVFTSDVIDVLCYCIGGVVFYYIQELHFRKSSSM